jgi:Flp pilus assembly protein TadG
MFIHRSPNRSSLTRRRGNAILDAAFVLPVLLALTFGSIEYGYFFFVKHSLQGAAREGARAAIVPDATNPKVTAAVAASLNAAGLNSSTTQLDSKFVLTLTPSDVTTAATGASVTVQVDSTWGSVGVRPMGLIVASKTVRGVTVMRRE